MPQFSVRWTLTFICLFSITACNPVRMATNTIGLTDKGLEAGQKLHLKVAPEEAIRRRRIETNWSTSLYLGMLPPFSLNVADHDHMIGEHLAEPGVGELRGSNDRIGGCDVRGNGERDHVGL